MDALSNRRDVVTGKTLARIGLGLLLLGIVFLYRWGIEQEIITPAARVGVGVALSLGLLSVGWVTRPRQVMFGALLQGGGVAGLFVSAFAAHAVYGLSSPTAVFTQLVFISALGIGLAVHEKIETLAVVGVLGALAAPQMVPGTIEMFPGDAGYVAIVLVVVGALLYRFDWTVLFAVSAIATGLTLATELLGVLGGWGFTGPEALIAYAAALAALWGAPMLRIATRRPQNAIVAMVATVTVPVAAYFGAWSAWDNPSPLAAGIPAAALATGMAAVYFSLREREPFVAVLHLIPASVLSLTAVGLMFDGPSLMFTFAAQGAGFILIGRRLRMEPMEMLGWVTYTTVATFVTIQIVIEPSGAIPALNGEALARLGVIALAAALAIPHARVDDSTEPVVARFLLGFAHIAFLAWGMSELARTPIGHPTVSVFWGSYALIIVAVAWRKSSLARNVGIATLLVTVAKVFLVDLESASGGAKILLLMGFGLALLALGYLMPSDGSDSDRAESPDARPEGPLEDAL